MAGKKHKAKRNVGRRSKGKISKLQREINALQSEIREIQKDIRKEAQKQKRGTKGKGSKKGNKWPRKVAWRSGFRRYCRPVPRKGKSKIFAMVLVMFEMSAGNAGKPKTFIDPIDFGIMGYKKAKAITLGDAMQRADELGYWWHSYIVELVGVVALRPKQDRKALGKIKKYFG